MINVATKAKTTAIYATVIRANGRQENRGLVAYWAKNPLKHYAVNAYLKIRRFFQ